MYLRHPILFTCLYNADIYPTRIVVSATHHDSKIHSSMTKYEDSVFFSVSNHLLVQFSYFSSEKVCCLSSLNKQFWKYVFSHFQTVIFLVFTRLFAHFSFFVHFFSCSVTFFLLTLCCCILGSVYIVMALGTLFATEYFQRLLKQCFCFDDNVKARF